MKKHPLENPLDISSKVLIEIIEKKLDKYYLVLILYCLFQNSTYFLKYSQYLVKNNELSKEILKSFLYSIVSLTGGIDIQSDLLTQKELESIWKNTKTTEIFLNSVQLQDELHKFKEFKKSENIDLFEVSQHKYDYKMLYMFYISIITMNNQNDNKIFVVMFEKLKIILDYLIQNGRISKTDQKANNFKEILKIKFEKEFQNLMSFQSKLKAIKRGIGGEIIDSTEN